MAPNNRLKLAAEVGGGVAAAHARRSLAGALGGRNLATMTHRPLFRITVLLGGVGLAQLVGYFAWSHQAMVGTIAPFLPSPSRCSAVCVNSVNGMSSEQRKSLDQLLRTRYSEVYGSLDEILALRPLDDLEGICVINWDRSASGIFWYQASYSGAS